MSFSENSTLRPFSRDSHQSLEYGPTRGPGASSVNSYPQSPYTEPDLYSLDVGPNKTRFRVHRMVLSQSPELEVKPSGMLWGERTSDSLVLPELDEPTAHTLVHYLYSGRYQTLESFSDASGKSGTVSAYRLGTCVYCAAMRYQLPGLAELAKERITSIAQELTILQILGVARDHAFPNLPKTESWYPSYLEGAIQAAVNEDPELFRKPEFADQVEGDRRFRQIVLGAMVNAYAKGTSDRTTGVSTPMTDVKAEPLDASVVSECADSERQLRADAYATQEPQDQISPRTAESTVAPTSSDHVPEPDNKVVKTAEDETLTAHPVPEKDDLKLDEIEPSAPAPLEPEPFTDELGFASSKTYQNMGQKDANPEKPRVAIDTKSAAPMHKRVDSAIQAPEGSELKVTSVESTAVEAEKPEVSNAAIAADPAAKGASPTPKKNKSKKKKKSAAAAAAAAKE